MQMTTPGTLPNGTYAGTNLLWVPTPLHSYNTFLFLLDPNLVKVPVLTKIFQHNAKFCSTQDIIMCVLNSKCYKSRK